CVAGRFSVVETASLSRCDARGVRLFDSRQIRSLPPATYTAERILTSHALWQCFRAVNEQYGPTSLPPRLQSPCASILPKAETRGAESDRSARTLLRRTRVESLVPATRRERLHRQRHRDERAPARRPARHRQHAHGARSPFPHSAAPAARRE